MPDYQSVVAQGYGVSAAQTPLQRAVLAQIRAEVALELAEAELADLRITLRFAQARNATLTHRIKAITRSRDIWKARRAPTDDKRGHF